MTEFDRLLDLVECRMGMSREAGLIGRLARSLGEPAPGLAARLAAAQWRDPAWQAFIEPLVVHESYLCRDWPQLRHLAEAGLPGLIATRPALRVWSAGCAAGEEAYTLGALTLDAMVRAGAAGERGDAIVPVNGRSLSVLGSDVSVAAIARAQRGAFQTAGLSAFRSLPVEFDRFFPQGGPGERTVRPDLRGVVRFLAHDLLSGPAPVAAADVVACRNVLVYLTAAARRAAMDRVMAAVTPGGYLLLGPTDPAPRQGFVPVWASDAVIHRRL